VSRIWIVKYATVIKSNSLLEQWLKNHEKKLKTGYKTMDNWVITKGQNPVNPDQQKCLVSFCELVLLKTNFLYPS